MSFTKKEALVKMFDPILTARVERIYDNLPEGVKNRASLKNIKSLIVSLLTVPFE